MTEHWHVYGSPEKRARPAIVTDAERAEACRADGYEVEGPFVDAERLRGAVEAFAVCSCGYVAARDAIGGGRP